MTASLMDVWAQCQPVPVTPHPDDVRYKGYRCRRRPRGGWCMYVPQSGDWYRCQPADEAALDALLPTPAPSSPVSK